MNPIKKTFDIGDGRMIEIETGKLAKQADGSVVVNMPLQAVFLEVSYVVRLVYQIMKY